MLEVDAIGIVLIPYLVGGIVLNSIFYGTVRDLLTLSSLVLPAG